MSDYKTRAQELKETDNVYTLMGIVFAATITTIALGGVAANYQKCNKQPKTKEPKSKRILQR